MRSLLDRILKRFMVQGRLTVRWPDGAVTSYAGAPGTEAMIEIKTMATVRRLALNPALTVGEAYMDGLLVPVDSTIFEVLDVLMTKMGAETSGHTILKLRELLGRLTRRVAQFNPAGRSQRNVAHHYDLNGRLYSLFLDRDRQYSCAYFPRGDETIDEAQVAKKRHIAAKLLLNRPGLSVLDVGCGWGGLGITLAKDYGARVTGITLSKEQLVEAQARVRAEGLEDRVSFELMDYRALRRRFDRIVSVGMFEHVGVGHYRQFFDMVKTCLEPDGVCLLHAIGRSDGPSSTNPWIARYIFPGGYCPSLSEVLPPIEQAGLVTTDMEILRLHYAETLRHWRRRFAANRDTIASLYDERFCRMFEFYLAGSELAFRRQKHMIFQIQITRDQTAVPLTRDYITDTERAMASRTRVGA
jgi:cyclopropane-fatty-acyl-phospholipid synthase